MASLERRTIFHQIAEKGMEISEITLKNMAFCLNYTDQEGFTPLFLAVKNGHMEMAKLFIKYGADLNYRTEKGVHLIHIAAKFCNPDTVKFIFEGQDVNLEDSKNLTPLFYAVGNKNLEMVEFLIERKANIWHKTKLGKNILHHAAQYGTRKIFEIILSEGGSILMCDCFLKKSPLLYAILGSNKEIVKLLLDNGAKVDIADNIGKNPLHYVAEYGNPEIATLIEKSCSLDFEAICDVYSWPPLFFAIRANNIKMVQYLLSKKVLTNFINIYGENINTVQDIHKNLEVEKLINFVK